MRVCFDRSSPRASLNGGAKPQKLPSQHQGQLLRRLKLSLESRVCRLPTLSIPVKFYSESDATHFKLGRFPERGKRGRGGRRKKKIISACTLRAALALLSRLGGGVTSRLHQRHRESLCGEGASLPTWKNAQSTVGTRTSVHFLQKEPKESLVFFFVFFLMMEPNQLPFIHTVRINVFIHCLVAFGQKWRKLGKVSNCS